MNTRRPSTKLLVAETMQVSARVAGVPIEDWPEMDAAEFMRHREAKLRGKA